MKEDSQKYRITYTGDGNYLIIINGIRYLRETYYSVENIPLSRVRLFNSFHSARRWIKKAVRADNYGNTNET